VACSVDKRRVDASLLDLFVLPNLTLLLEVHIVVIMPVKHLSDLDMGCVLDKEIIGPLS
jgi:hypothetical protein